MALIQRMDIIPNLAFLARRKLFLVFSVGLVAASVALVLVQGLNFGVDFRGGILIEARTNGPADLSALRGRLSGLGLGEITLQNFGEPTEILINIQRQEGGEAEKNAAIRVVKEALGDWVVEYRRTEFVGPKVGGELKRAGALATGLSLLAIGVYIWFRFEWHFSIAALVALLHDVVATVGFYALTQIEFNLATLAAILMIAGYSINDTVVVFDRVRENLRKFKKMSIFELLDRSINQTLTRTLLTSITTLLALVALFLFGGPVIRGFTAGLIWGVVIGTYSSIALAVPLLARFNLRGAATGSAGGKAGEDAAEAG